MRVSLFVFALLALIAGIDAQRYFAEQIPSGVSWSAREKANVEFVKRTTSFRDGDNNGRAVTLTNYFLLYGGVTDVQPANDVWASTNGRQWYFVAGNADGTEHPNYPETFPQVYDASHCQDAQYRQYRVGGSRDGQVFNDVWMSIDGFNWREMTPAAEFDPVYLANMVGDATAIYIAGGILDATGNPRQSSPTVWRSVNQGRTWQQVYSGYNAQGTISGPGARAVSILLNAEQHLIWMTGVNSGYETGDRPESYQKDVWVSTNSGRNWDPVNLNTPFGRRDDSNAEMASSGIIVLAGGYGGTGQSITGQTGEIYNDVWASADGGYSWGLCVGDAEWDDRRYQMTLLDGDGYLWVMGGVGGSDGRRYADIWKSQWTFADASATASRCKLSVPSCGAGLKCLPNSGNTLVASDGSGVYCDACPYTFSGTAAVTTTVTIFLVVFIILFAVAVLALIYTYYKLRSAGAPSPIPLPATAQRWWNKSTNGAVGGSSDAGSTTNGDGLYQPLRIRDQV